MTNSKLYQEINSHLERNPNWQPYIGKAKIKQGVDLWPGKWKRIMFFMDSHVTLEDSRGFKISEIDQFLLTPEYMQYLSRYNVLLGFMDGNFNHKEDGQ